MSNLAPYVDISSFQPPASQIDWNAYIAWSKANAPDGLSRLCIRSSQGTPGSGNPDALDKNFIEYRTAFEAHGGDILIIYHYAYPQFNSAVAEAEWQQQVVGAMRPHDMLMLDYEEDNAHSTAQWALDFMQAQQQHYPETRIVLYTYANFIPAHLQDVRLANYGLILANYGYSLPNIPPCPPPWLTYQAWQWTDSTSVPGIPGTYDGDYWLMTLDEQQVTSQIWSAVLHTVNMQTGIFEMWLSAYKAGHVWGPALTQEQRWEEADGRTGVFQVFPAGYVRWVDGVGAFVSFNP